MFFKSIICFLFISVGMLQIYAFDFYNGVFAKGEITFAIDAPQTYCRPAGKTSSIGIHVEEMLQLIFPEMPDQTSLRYATAFSVDRLYYLLDGQTIATDVSGDNCKDSDPNSSGSDLRTIFDSTKEYKLTEHVFALYAQEENNCAISYKIYRTLDATFWTLPVKLKQKKGLAQIVALGELKDTDCSSISINDSAVQKLLKKELKSSFISAYMKPETEEKY